MDIDVTAGEWKPFFIPWSDFDRAEWADEAGLAELDPSRVTGYGFSMGAAEGGGEGNLWVDDVALAAGAAEPEAGPTAEPTLGPVDAGESRPEAPDEDEGREGGFCPLPAVVLPLGLLTVVLTRRRR